MKRTFDDNDHSNLSPQQRNSTIPRTSTNSNGAAVPSSNAASEEPESSYSSPRASKGRRIYINHDRTSQEDPAVTSVHSSETTCENHEQHSQTEENNNLPNHTQTGSENLFSTEDLEPETQQGNHDPLTRTNSLEDSIEPTDTSRPKRKADDQKPSERKSPKTSNNTLIGTTLEPKQKTPLITVERAVKMKIEDACIEIDDYLLAETPTTLRDALIALPTTKNQAAPTDVDEKTSNWPCYILSFLFKSSAFFGKNTLLYLTLCKKTGIEPKEFSTAKASVKGEIFIEMAILTSFWAVSRFYNKETPSSKKAQWIRYALFLISQGVSSSILYSAVKDHTDNTIKAATIVIASSISNYIANISKLPTGCVPESLTTFPCLKPIPLDSTNIKYPLTGILLCTGGLLDCFLFSYQILPSTMTKLNLNKVTLLSSVTVGSLLMTNIVYFQFSYLSLMGQERAFFSAPTSYKLAIVFINAGIGLGAFYLGRFTLASAGVQGELSDYSAIWNALYGGFIAGSFHMAKNQVTQTLPTETEPSLHSAPRSTFTFIKQCIYSCFGIRNNNKEPKVANATTPLLSAMDVTGLKTNALPPPLLSPSPTLSHSSTDA